jgi:serine/threonine protein phosphatase PrpC
LRVEHAELSLKGARESNQDRVGTEVANDAALLLAVDGMGGHEAGEKAAMIALKTIVERFRAASQPMLDPIGFLHLALGAAHQQIVGIGTDIPVENRPRATIALCLVLKGSAYWAHVGDSRAYHLRRGKLVARTRDHSHVELLVREGVIGADQVHNHPMRNFVESCLGGEPLLPEMELSRRQPIEKGDVLLVCTDGFWTGASDEVIAEAFADGQQPFDEALAKLGAAAVMASGASCDNTSAAALRYME